MRTDCTSNALGPVAMALLPVLPAVPVLPGLVAPLPGAPVPGRLVFDALIRPVIST